jgi:hypothetical protein
VDGPHDDVDLVLLDELPDLGDADVGIGGVVFPDDDVLVPRDLGTDLLGARQEAGFGVLAEDGESLEKGGEPDLDRRRCQAMPGAGGAERGARGQQEASSVHLPSSEIV